VNDEESPVKLIEDMTRFATICNTCIECVLHMAPSGMKLQELLGLEEEWKAVAFILVE
jgi:hypothetical protein